jgi:hypothetical protein
MLLLDQNEIKLVGSHIYNILIQKDRSYLNFLGELACLVLIKKQYSYRLNKIEYKLPNGKRIDFQLIDSMSKIEYLFEITNIHIDAKKGISEDWSEVSKFFTNRITKKIKDKTHQLTTPINITLIPVVWSALGSDIMKLHLHFQQHELNIENVEEPLAFVVYDVKDLNAENPNREFGPIKILFGQSS